MDRALIDEILNEIGLEHIWEDEPANEDVTA